MKSGLVEKYSQVKSGLLRTEVEKDLMKDNSHRSSGTARYDSEYSRSGLSELQKIGQKNIGNEFRD